MEITLKDDRVLATVYQLEKHLQIPSSYDLEISRPEAEVKLVLKINTCESSIIGIDVYSIVIDCKIDFIINCDYIKQDELDKIVSNWDYNKAKNEISGTVNLHIEPNANGWRYKNELEFQRDGGFQIGGLEIDFEEKLITTF